MFRVILICVLISAVSSQQSLSDNFITNAKATEIVNFPYHVSFMHGGKHICGGAIIQLNYILTAAHCFTSDNEKEYRVRAGSSWSYTEGKIYELVKISKHNLYEVILEFDDKRLYDIAVVKVKGMKFSKVIQPIRLPKENYQIPYLSVGTLTGWGATSEGGSISDVLRYAQIRIWKQSHCAQVFGKRKIRDVVFCTGSKGQDACYGDSGGPFVVGGKVIGIVSWGKGCGRQGYPSVYTNVAALLPWIDASLNYLKYA